MIALMMTTFLLFFAFVINVGMLVNAKINLQNAADMAAYAGAATQARQLNTISYLNYEMRRQYKKFLFRYYVMGGMAQKSFANTSGPRLWSPDNNPSVNYQVPAVCLTFNPRDNFCQVARLPGIAFPPQIGIDAVNDALIGGLRSMEQSRQNNCMKIGRANMQALIYWLWNFDPELDAVQNFVDSTDDAVLREPFRIVKNLSTGLGLIPKLSLLNLRIKTMQYYVNFPAQKGVDRTTIQNLSSTGDAAARERTIQAFNSAYYTLGNHTFDSSQIQMDEILPEANSAEANLLKLDPISLRNGIDAYAIDLTLGPNQPDTPPGQTPTSCNPLVTPITVNRPVTVGFKKDPKVLTYYAVRLKAKAKILFSPFGDVQLTAYSAAQPFGSRLGPSRIDEGDFVWKVVGNNPSTDPAERASPACGLGTRTGGGIIRCAEQIPNLAIRPGDTSNGGGWNRNEVIHAMHQQFTVGFGPAATQPSSIGPLELQNAYHAAMAPNPIERGQYNIPNSYEDAMTEEFDGHVMAFWAPIISADKLNNLNDVLREELQGFMPPQTGAMGGAVGSFQGAFQAGILSYIGQLRQSRGENGEGFNVVRITDPLNQPPRAGQRGGQIRLPANILMSARDDIKTSWNEVVDDNFAVMGRTGYSVKYVSFKTLRQESAGRVTANGSETWNNTLPANGDESADLPFIDH